MKKQFKFLMLSAALLVAVPHLISCTKSKTSPTPTPTPTPTTGFTWTENGGSTVLKADSAYFSNAGLGSSLFAFRGGQLAFEINLNDSSVAVHTLGRDNVITYTAVSPYFNPTTGNITLSASSSTKVSGTFEGSGPAAAGITAIKGSFTNIAVRP